MLLYILIPSFALSAPTDGHPVAVAGLQLATAVIGGGFAIYGQHPQPTGTCAWFGVALFCYGYCPPEYNKIRESDDWQLHDDRGNTHNDVSFGHYCYFGHKYFCCKPDKNECLWRGTWVDTLNRKFSCEFWKLGKKLQDLVGPSGTPRRECGEIRCTSTYSNKLVQVTTPLLGEKCTDFEMFGLYARADCGVINWLSNSTSVDIVDSWYKLSR